ncbi:MAG TPA: GntR family transcriptional regulator [Xanthobacteraceae bacterium]|nr:GntR family transcriptional regulator [Xanthobacteraceae bacterium]
MKDVIITDTQVSSPLPLRIQAYDKIENMIMKGVLQPGERLIETELSNALKVSRGPVREALQLLERDGWVETRPRYGAVVRRRTTPEVAELFEVRRTLERRSMEIAAGRITAAEKRHLKKLQDRAEALFIAKDMPGLIEANSAVHNFLPTLSGNTTMSELFRTVNRRIRWYTLTPQIFDRAQSILTEQRDIVDAIVAGESSAAANAMDHHNAKVWETYMEWLAMNKYRPGD